MAKKQIDLGLTGLDELFMDDKERAESKLPKIYEIPLSEIDEFPNHPFHVRLDEDMDQLVESIKERGIITSVTLRQKPDGRYEIVSGHRRAKACELAGLTTVKAEIKELSRDEAIILMMSSSATVWKMICSLNPGNTTVPCSWAMTRAAFPDTAMSGELLGTTRGSCPAATSTTLSLSPEAAKPSTSLSLPSTH